MNAAGGRLLALDVGARRIGVAISDPTQTIAQPLGNVERSQLDADIRQVLDLVKTHAVCEIIVGLPRLLSGRLGEQAEAVLAFLRELQAATPIPVTTWDERLTTKEAERVLREAGVSTRRQKVLSDRIAAQRLLMTVLERRRSS